MAKRGPKMSELTAVRFPVAMMEEIEDWRRAQRVIPAKGVAIRELVRAGLDAYAGKKLVKQPKAPQPEARQRGKD